ncbi:MAG: BamA/TamA family outer membrane protein [Flavobacteriales bacterium]
MKLCRTLVLILMLGLTIQVSSQDINEASVTLPSDSLVKDSIPFHKNFFLGIPAAFYTPETRWGFGAAGIYNFYTSKTDSISPSSQVQLAATYTQNKQVLLFLPFNLFWDEFNNVVQGEFGYYDYLYPFYGIGSETLESNYETYNSRYFRFQLDALRRVRKNTFLGIRYWFDNPEIDGFREDGILDAEIIRGQEGGAISGAGPQIRIDKRDNVYSTKKGLYVNTIFQNFSELIGSQYAFNRIRIDARKFIQLKKEVVIAGQFYSDITWGDVPFFQQARLGGTKQLRGYLDGRFLDNSSITPQIETRFKIWKRFGGVAFGGVGTVFKTFSDLEDSRWRYNYGAGLRYTLEQEKQINIRLDYALTPEGANFYFTIGEAF